MAWLGMGVVWCLDDAIDVHVCVRVWCVQTDSCVVCLLAAAIVSSRLFLLVLPCLALPCPAAVCLCVGVSSECACCEPCVGSLSVAPAIRLFIVDSLTHSLSGCVALPSPIYSVHSLRFIPAVRMRKDAFMEMISINCCE
uniref:Uncharacterized protein n=1 Tax=Vitrella brassicaformis TaxID=1169539 RepID=A0A7S1P1D7_9ALVE